jgi:hypothetical protein
MSDETTFQDLVNPDGEGDLLAENVKLKNQLERAREIAYFGCPVDKMDDCEREGEWTCIGCKDTYIDEGV